MIAVKAYYSKGRFVPLNLDELPEGTPAIITVLDETFNNNLCDFGYVHDYSKISPSSEDEYQTFDSWKAAKEWLRA